MPSSARSQRCNTTPHKPLRSPPLFIVVTASTWRDARRASMWKGAWHPYRRLLATDSRGLPGKDIMQAAGWKSAKTLHIYQKSDDAGVLAVFERRQRHAREGVA